MAFAVHAVLAEIESAKGPRTLRRTPRIHAGDARGRGREGASRARDRPTRRPRRNREGSRSRGYEGFEPRAVDCDRGELPGGKAELSERTKAIAQAPSRRCPDGRSLPPGRAWVQRDRPCEHSLPSAEPANVDGREHRSAAFRRARERRHRPRPRASQCCLPPSPPTSTSFLAASIAPPAILGPGINRRARYRCLWRCAPARQLDRRA